MSAKSLSGLSLPGGASLERINKAVTAGIGAGSLAFVPLATLTSRVAVIADVACAIAVGVGTAVVTYWGPANAPKDTAVDHGP